MPTLGETSSVVTEMAGLAVFDLDGTLLPGTTACQQIALAAGDPQTVASLELDYRRGVIDSVTFAERASMSWDKAPSDLYRRAFDACPKIGGLDRTLEWLRAHSYATCLVTMGPREFAECFEAFDYVYASTYPSQILNPADKPDVVRELQRQLCVDSTRTIAFGDSDSDVPLFTELSRTVAVNATPNLTAIAAYSYDGDDLWRALGLVEPISVGAPGSDGAP